MDKVWIYPNLQNVWIDRHNALIKQYTVGDCLIRKKDVVKDEHGRVQWDDEPRQKNAAFIAWLKLIGMPKDIVFVEFKVFVEKMDEADLGEPRGLHWDKGINCDCEPETKVIRRNVKMENPKP